MTMQEVILRSIPFLRLRMSMYWLLQPLWRLSTGNSSSPSPVELTLAPGVRMYLRDQDFGHKIIRGTGVYELEQSRQIVSLGKNVGGLLVDVGANYGYYTLLWLAASPMNRVIAIEPWQPNVVALRSNLELNEMSSRCQVLTLAAGRREERLTFQVGGAGQTGWGGLSLAPGTPEMEVEVKPLNSILEKEREVSVLKIDTEGADAWVLEGARPLLEAKAIKHVFFEAPRYSVWVMSWWG